jgi:hypothetical protein
MKRASEISEALFIDMHTELILYRLAIKNGQVKLNILRKNGLGKQVE